MVTKRKTGKYLYKYRIGKTRYEISHSKRADGLNWQFTVNGILLARVDEDTMTSLSIVVGDLREIMSYLDVRKSNGNPIT